MPLKLKVEKLEEVPEAQRALYAEDKDGGGFLLGVEGLEDTGALKRAKEHEATARKAAEARAKVLEDEKKASDEAARKAKEEAALKAGDVETIRKSGDERVAAKETEWKTKYDADIGSLSSDVTRLLIDNVATTLASQIALEGSAPVLIPHIASRLAVEVRDGQRVTVVKGADGKPSALTIDDLRKEIVGNKAFAPLLVASKASGGGAGGGGKGGGAAGAKQITREAFNALDDASRRAHVRGGGSVTD